MERNSFLAGVIAGAGLAYMTDPISGRRRRKVARDRLVSIGNQTRDAADTAARDLKNRTRGMAAAARARLRDHPTDDVRLVERVRSALGRVTSHPRAIDVSAERGCVTLCGPILSAEADHVVSAVSGIPGVSAVNDALERHDTADAPSLQGAGPLNGSTLDLFQQRWSPATRTIVGAAAITAAVAAWSAYSRRAQMVPNGGSASGLW